MGMSDLKIFKKKGQTFSTDIIIVAVIVLMALIFIVVNGLVDNESDESKKIIEESEHVTLLIMEELKNQNVIKHNNEVNVEGLMQVDINEIKESLNMKEEFCIVFEKDGKLIKIDADNEIHGIGSGKIVVNGKPCSSS